MKGTLSFYLLAGVAFAQTTAKLNSDLSALANPQTSASTVANRVAEDVLTLAEKDAQPSRGTVLVMPSSLLEPLSVPRRNWRRRLQLSSIFSKAPACPVPDSTAHWITSAMR
jgi:hypothetical protein